MSLIAEVTARSMTKMATHDDDQEGDVCNVKKHMSRTVRLSNNLFAIRKNEIKVHGHPCSSSQ